MERLSAKITRILGSNGFFWAVIGLFLLQALWLVFSAIYPAAFDEAYHFTFIRVFADQWSPLISERPADVDELGVITRDTSYLFHYLMSFPYRVITLFTQDQVSQVIWLRLINVGLFTAALVLMRRVMSRAGVPKAFAHSSIWLFIMVPIVPLLSAHTNYDNLLLLLVVWMVLLTMHITKSLKDREVPIREVLALAAVMGFAGVVKTAVLPIVLALAVFVAVYAWKVFRGKGGKQLFEMIRSSWFGMARPLRIVLLVALLLGSGLFVERYGGNLVIYGSISPSCHDVISTEQCMAFGPYERTVNYLENTEGEFEPEFTSHVIGWSHAMWYRTFFMINGDLPVDRYQNFPPLPLPALSITIAALGGLITAGVYWRQIFYRPEVIMLLTAAGFYVLTLWYINYSSVSYQETGRIAAANGRYFIMAAPMLMAVGGLGYRYLFKTRKRLAALAVAVVLIMSLNGGGVVSFWARSSDTWYWPHPSVQNVNQATSEAVSPLLIGKDWVPPL